MSSAFVRESDGVPRVFSSRDSAESNAEMQRSIDTEHDYAVKARERGGFMVARLGKDGAFEAWVEE